jgi:hypothetical protein
MPTLTQKVLGGVALASLFRWLRKVGGTVRQFVADLAIGWFRDATTGKTIPPSVVRESLDAVTGQARIAMRDLAQRLIDGKIDLATWEAMMLDAVKKTHVSAALLGVGGIDGLTPVARLALSDSVQFHLSALHDFATEIESGVQPINGTLANRAGYYGDAVTGTYEDFRRLKQSEIGVQWERRILGPPGTESCEDCIRAAKLGWQRPGVLPRVGQSRCLVNCKCSFRFSTSETRPLV